jgi:hypothetical protein
VSQYYDANGDGLIAPIDALFVLNRMPGSWPIGGGEGESDITQLQDAAQDSEESIGSGIEGLDLTFVTGRRDASARRIDDFFHGYDGSMGVDGDVEDGDLRPGRRGQPRRWK